MIADDKSQKRSPITDKPLRTAGQSLNEEIDNLINDRVLGYCFMAAGLFLFTGSQWYIYLTRLKITLLYLISLSIFNILIILFCVYKITGIIKKVRSIKLGLDGEKFMGDFLDSLKEKGYKVVHDVVNDRGNIDHVIVSPRGVYTVETKTRMKPGKGEISVMFDGEAISINGDKPDKAPIIQALAQANWLEEFIKHEVNKDISVQPVVVYPEWWVEEKAAPSNSKVKVLNHKRFLGYIELKEESIDSDTLTLIYNRLASYVKGL